MGTEGGGTMTERYNLVCAEMVLSAIFRDGEKRQEVKQVLQRAKEAGMGKQIMKDARKNLGVKSENADGTYWWVWPDDKDPDTVNREKSEEMMRNERIGD